MAEKDEGKRVRRVSRRDLKLVRAAGRRLDRKRREYQKWQEKQLDKLLAYGQDVHRAWVLSWRDGHVVNRDDPTKPETLDRLPHEVSVRARKFEDELYDLGERLDDYMERLGDLHKCPASAIVMSPRDANGRPTGKMVGEIDYDTKVDEEESLPADDVPDGIDESVGPCSAADIKAAPEVE